MTETCQICQLPVTEPAHFYKVHHISAEKYHRQFFPKFDLQTKEPLTFKSPEQYLNDDFNCKNNLKAYLGSISDEAAFTYITSLFKRRKELKGLVYLPGQFELRSILIPPASYILKKWSTNQFNQLLKDADLVNRYNYQTELKYAKVSELEIIIDSRESKPWRFGSNVNVDIQKLSVGDYALKNNPQRIFIERKSLSDWCSTISKGYERFIKEVERAKKEESYLIVVIEDKYENLMSYNFLSWFKHIKATPSFIMHRAREICQNYPETIQCVAVDGRIKSVDLVVKLFSLDNIEVRKLDIQYLYDKKVL